MLTMPRSGGKGGTAALAWPSLIFIGSPLEFGSPLLFFLKHLPSQEIELEALKRLLNSKWRSPCLGLNVRDGRTGGRVSSLRSAVPGREG